MTAPQLALVFPEPLLSIKRACETHCVAGCCGLDAFVVDTETMAPWVRDEGLAPARTALSQLDEILEVLRIHDGAVTSPPDEFNWMWPTGVDAAAYFETWRRVLVRAIDSVDRGPHSRTAGA